VVGLTCIERVKHLACGGRQADRQTDTNPNRILVVTVVIVRYPYKELQKKGVNNQKKKKLKDLLHETLICAGGRNSLAQASQTR